MFTKEHLLPLLWISVLEVLCNLNVTSPPVHDQLFSPHPTPLSVFPPCSTSVTYEEIHFQRSLVTFLRFLGQKLRLLSFQNLYHLVQCTFHYIPLLAHYS